MHPPSKPIKACWGLHPVRSCEPSTFHWSQEEWYRKKQFAQPKKEGNVLFNDALNTFYLRLYGIRHMVKDHSESKRGNRLAARVLLYASSHRQDITYHSLCYASRGALAGTRTEEGSFYLTMNSTHLRLYVIRYMIKDHSAREETCWSH